jgi:hypothetical protein
LDHASKYPPNLAGLLILAVVATPIGNNAQTGQWRERPVYQAEYLTKCNLIRGLQEKVSAELATPARDIALPLHLNEDLLKKALRNPLFGRDFGNEHGLLWLGFGQGNERTQCVFGLLRYHVWRFLLHPVPAMSIGLIWI